MVGADTGAQEPRIHSVPAYKTSLGQEAVELAKSAGLELDPWQALVLEDALGQRDDGSWASFEVGVVVPRQNGKGAILEARELAGLFLLGERLIIHSAHQFDTSLEAFRRLLWLIEDTQDLYMQVKRVSRSHGEEGIELKSGQRIRFRTRTKGGGRGFSSDCLILDEAMILPESAHGALLPTLSARPNPQVWYTGSAVDQLVHDDGVVLARIRERGVVGDDQSLAYFEWSASDESLIGIDLDLLSAAKARATANPGLGIRISDEHIDNELRSMDARTFAVERLGIGDYPATDGSTATVLSIDLLRRLVVDADSKIEGRPCFSFDVSPDRSTGTIAVAGSRADGLAQFEIVDHREGTGWIVGRLRDLATRHDPMFVCDGRSPAASLVRQLTDEGIEVMELTAQEQANACGSLFDLVQQEKVRHLGSSEFYLAVRGASQRPLGDAWAWSRKSSVSDITPLVAVTNAVWAAGIRAETYPEPMVAWA